MKIGLVLHELHRSENDLAHRLLQVSERHKVDHEIYHLVRYLYGWSQRHVREIAEIGQDYGQDLDPEPRTETGLGEELREKGSELVGRRNQAALPLLIGLRDVHTTPPACSRTGRRSPKPLRASSTETCWTSPNDGTPTPCASCAGPTGS